MSARKRSRRRKKVSAMQAVQNPLVQLVCTVITAVAMFFLGFGWLSLAFGALAAGRAASLGQGRVVATTKRPKRQPPQYGSKPRATRVLEGRMVSGRTRVGPRARVCNARCKTSRLPKATCQCVCGGRTHGSLR